MFLGGILAESPAFQGLEWESSQSNPGQKVIVEVFEGIDTYCSDQIFIETPTSFRVGSGNLFSLIFWKCFPQQYNSKDVEISEPPKKV